MKNLAQNKSTNVRLPFNPELMASALRLAPWLQKPLLTRLFLTPQRKKSHREYAAPVVGSVSVAGQTVRIRARGRGPTVMMVHGWQGHSGHFRSLGDRLVDDGFTVITFDMPAHGETSGRLTSLVEFMETVRLVAEFVGPIHGIVAHSLGATATALALARGLPVENVTLVAPMISFDFALDEFSKILHLDPALREAAAQGTEQRLGLNRTEADLKTLKLPALDMLLFHDRDDERTPFEHSTELARLWKNVEFYPTDGYGHREVLNAPEVGASISQFFRERPFLDSEPLHLGVIPEMRY